MQTGQMPSNDWRNEYLVFSELSSMGGDSELRAMVRAGVVHRVALGVYRFAAAGKFSAQWQHDDDDYLARIRGASLATSRPLVFSHHSAAALLALPSARANASSRRVHVVGYRAGGGRSTTGLVRHTVGVPDELEVRGSLTCTALARTVADVASVAPIPQAVAVADAALAGMQDQWGILQRLQLEPERLRDEIAGRKSSRGIRQLRWVAEFANGLSGSPGESISRWAMHAIGCPPPVLQQPFADSVGPIGIVDFWWPEFNVIGEFDGQSKYVREEYTAGADAADIVIAEKLREDRLRATASGPRVVRWGWDATQNLSLLARKLRNAGLPCSW